MPRTIGKTDPDIQRPTAGGGSAPPLVALVRLLAHQSAREAQIKPYVAGQPTETPARSDK